MPALFIGSLIGALGTAMASLVGRVLIALSIGYVTYSGFNALGQWIFDSMKASLMGMPIDAMNFLAFLWVDKVITLIFSAWTAALAIRMAGSSTITNMVVKK